MKYSDKNIENINNHIHSKELVSKCRITATDFIRNRKMSASDLILYQLNKRGLSSKMEIRNFNKINDVQKISSPAVFKAREKLNPGVFTYLIQDSLKTFYRDFKNEVKTYKNYILIAIDGSDFEIPNTKTARETYNGKQQDQCARVTVSLAYDVLNKYTLDTIVNPYDYSEIEMAKNHYKTIKKENIIDDYKSIRIMDRNYRNLDCMFQSIKEGEKFLLRISSSVYKKEIQMMISDDEEISISYECNRCKYYKDTAPELYEYLKSGNSLKVRCVKITLSTGEVEHLLTNLNKDEFSTEEINELYNLRWKIEVNYKHLKNNVKIETITSAKKILIEQDIFSQVLVTNMLQAFINESDEKLKECQYKDDVQTNKNMAIGIFKDTLIYILLEEDHVKRGKMMDELCEEIREYILPIKKGRKNPRKTNSKNKYHINQRKTF